MAHCPGKYPPFPPSLPAANQALRYGLFTANGIDGGLAGVKVDSPSTSPNPAPSAPIAENRMLGKDEQTNGNPVPTQCRNRSSSTPPGACNLYTRPWCAQQPNLRVRGPDLPALPAPTRSAGAKGKLQGSGWDGTGTGWRRGLLTTILGGWECGSRTIAERC